MPSMCLPRVLGEACEFTSTSLTAFALRLALFPSPPSPVHSPSASFTSSMDRPTQRNLFSRGSSPPGGYQDPTLQPSLNKYQHVSPPHSLREVAQPSPPAHVESLFNNLIAQTAAPQPTAGASLAPGGPSQQQLSNSAPATPVSITANSVSSTTSAPINSAESRQSALLSLLGTVASPATSTTSAPQQPQQIPTPPGSSHRSGLSANNESQGRMLLEQLMSG